MLRQVKESTCRGWTMRSQRGLFAGKQITFGNQISFSHRLTRRTWKPNVHKKKLYSELLNETFHINVTTAALRTIDKMGGLDNYILHTKDSKLDSLFGMKLKWRLYQAYELKHGKPFRSTPEQKLTVKEQWQQIVENYNRKKELTDAAVSEDSAPVEQRERSELV